MTASADSSRAKGKAFRMKAQHNRLVLQVYVDFAGACASRRHRHHAGGSNRGLWRERRIEWKRMREFLGLTFLVCASCVFAQNQDPEVVRAKSGIDRLRSLVESGVLPRAQLEKAEAAVADA